MEKGIIYDLPNYKQISLVRIINVHVALNFDIDLFLPPELEQRYNHVIKHN